MPGADPAPLPPHACPRVSRMPVILPAEVRRLLDAPNVAHLATLLPGGAPKVEPVWVAREGDFVLFTTDAASRKARNIAADRRVALSLVDFANPYEQVLIRGRVVEERADPELRFLDALSQRYTGAPFPRRKWGTRVIYVIEPSLARYHESPLAHRPGPAPA